MKKLTIRQVPLLFLFAPTLIAAIAIYLFLHHGFQASYELQLKANAEHVVTRVAQLSNQYLYNRQYSVLKEELQEFVAHSDSAIDNIVIYNKNGQFITALKLNQQVLHSDLSSYPEQPFYHQEPLYLAFGRIGVAQINHFDNELAIGFVQVSFNSDPAGQLSAQNYWGVFIITILAIGAGALLWRYRYFSFHRQLLAINHSLDDINKGFKHSRLDYDSQFSEINALHQQVNDAVSFFERRLTMKYFEVTALERNLKEANHYIALKKAEDENQPAVETQKHSDKPSLLTTIYQAAYQILQSKLAVIDNSIIADNGSNSSNSSNSNSREGATDEVRQSESVIDKVINELNLMLNEIKRLADISAGQLNSQPELISSGQLVNSISRLVAPLAYAKGLEVLIIQPNESFNVEVDINQVQQVLLTLIQHAIEATSQGYIKLTVELLPEATVPGHPGGKLVYKVQDTSVGFGPAQYNMLVDDLIDPKLFDDGWIYRGLSLLVAKKTIELMGGSFKIKSLAGLGAELTIELHDTVNDYAQQEINDYQGGNIVVYSPHIQSGDVIFNQLCDMGVIAILCVDEVQVKIELAKPNVDCAVLCRPVQTDTQQLFDKTLADIVARDLLHKCLLCTTLLSTQEPLLVNLPKSWKTSNKPFILSDLTEYFDFSNVSCTNGEVYSQEPIVSHSDSIEILAVDDNETNLKLLSVILRGYPVNLVQALNGREALVMSQRQVFDLILMDKEMPDMDGTQTSQHIRQQTLNKHTPIVAFTAHLSDGERSALVGELFNDCMEKPLDEGKFYYLMDSWCKTRWKKISVTAEES